MPLERSGRDHLTLGARAEALAAALLEAKGYQILVRNWRRPEGEIDIVAIDQGTVVFVEVRSRSGEEFGHPLESINPRKKAQIVRAARLFLEESQGAAADCRFDVVGLVFGPEGTVQETVHIEDAFQVGYQ